MQKTINKHNLSIANLASKEASRFTLGAIQVTPEHTEVTDGHILMRVANPALTCDSFPTMPGLTFCEGDYLLSRDNALALAKALPKSTLPILGTAAFCSNGAVDSEGNALRYAVVTDLESVTKKAIETSGRFPDADRVIPKSDTMDLAVSFDARLLGSLCDQFVRMGNKKQIVPITMHIARQPKGTYGQSNAVLVTGRTDENQDVTAVIMPTRSDDVQAFCEARDKRVPTLAEYQAACSVVDRYNASLGRAVVIDGVDEVTV